MSDPVPTWNLFEASEYVRERTRDAICPCCGTRKWLLETQTGGLLEFRPRPGYIPFETRAYWDEAPAIPVIVYTCDNCGFIRQHNAVHITRKLQGG